MSAYVVSRETMQTCVTALHDRHLSCEDADQLGRALFELNEKAVNCRYPNGPQDIGAEADWRWRVTCPMLDGYGVPEDRKIACEWLKALQCLHYQMSEGDEVPASLLYATIEKHIRKIAMSLATSLPEYKAAPWDWPESTPNSSVCV